MRRRDPHEEFVDAFAEKGEAIRKFFGFPKPKYPGALDTMPKKNPHAVALGRLGGAATKGIRTKAKRKSSRENGKLGGRPRKK
jgi:hypothetical protein